jgi:hypothetical protein
VRSNPGKITSRMTAYANPEEILLGWDILSQAERVENTPRW